MIASKHKTGSRKRRIRWDLIVVALNSVEKPAFKVNQRAIRDHYNKTLNAFNRKKSTVACICQSKVAF